jgi:hypothetical protein
MIRYAGDSLKPRRYQSLEITAVAEIRMRTWFFRERELRVP